jgi:hypothetical protein
MIVARRNAVVIPVTKKTELQIQLCEIGIKRAKLNPDCANGRTTCVATDVRCVRLTDIGLRHANRNFYCRQRPLD